MCVFYSSVIYSICEQVYEQFLICIENLSEMSWFLFFLFFFYERVFMIRECVKKKIRNLFRVFVGKFIGTFVLLIDNVVTSSE